MSQEVLLQAENPEDKGKDGKEKRGGLKAHPLGNAIEKGQSQLTPWERDRSFRSDGLCG